MTTTTLSPAASLAEALGAPMLDHGGDPRILTPTGYIYSGFTGQVRVVHRGHVHTLGTWRDDTDVLVAAYRAAVGAVTP